MERYTGYNFDAITIEDCIDIYEKCNGYVEINDGKIITIVRGGWTC